MNLYTISGLGADKRVFDSLALPNKTIHLDWIVPLKRESLRRYAHRLTDQIDSTKPFSLLGVSFGGMLAIEIANYLKPNHTIIVSSAQTKFQIPILYRFLGKIGLIPLIPSWLLKPPTFIASVLFGTKQSSLLKSILKDTDRVFLKWAIHAICTWNNTKKTENLTHIHGTKDKIIPLPKDPSVVTIADGGHFMIVDKAEQIQNILNA